MEYLDIKQGIFCYNIFMKICLSEDCDLPAVNQGKKRKDNVNTEYCQKHYYRLKRNGSLEIKRLPPNRDRGCSVEGCTNKHGSRGFCYSHYKARADRETKCVLNGCNRNIESRKTGLCSTHQDLLRNGADLDTMIEVYKKFDGKCEICGTTDPKGYYGKFHTDHDHVTGKVRGLLCDQCNKGLGHFKDNIGYLESAVRYLNEAIQ